MSDLCIKSRLYLSVEKKVFVYVTGSQLDDVWSIRKNVQVSQAGKKGTVLNGSKSTSSYYSRHGGLSGEGYFARGHRLIGHFSLQFVNHRRRK